MLLCRNSKLSNDPAYINKVRFFFGGGGIDIPFPSHSRNIIHIHVPEQTVLFPFNGNSMGPSYLRRADADRRETDAVGARPRRRRLGGRAVRRRPVDDHYRPVRHARAVAASLRVDRCR